MIAVDVSTQDEILDTVAQRLLLWVMMGGGADPETERAPEAALCAVTALLRVVRAKRSVGGTAADTLGQ